MRPLGTGRCSQGERCEEKGGTPPPKPLRKAVALFSTVGAMSGPVVDEEVVLKELMALPDCVEDERPAKLPQVVAGKAHTTTLPAPSPTSTADANSAEDDGESSASDDGEEEEEERDPMILADQVDGYLQQTITSSTNLDQLTISQKVRIPSLTEQIVPKLSPDARE